MNDELRMRLGRHFDGEPPEAPLGDPADGPEARAYLRQLDALRELARRHDPAARSPHRCAVVFPVRPRRRVLAATMALAASMLVGVIALRTQPRAVPVVAPRTASGLRVAATHRVRTARPPLEVEIYRLANSASPERDDVVRAVLSWGEPRHGRAASREVLALELANAPPGLAPRLARSAATHAGPARRAPAVHRPRPVSSPKV